MNRTTLLLTLATLLAACSSNQIPQNSISETELPHLSIQAVLSTTVSLSVLPPVGNQVTAVVSSPYPSTTVCTLDWDDGNTTYVYVSSPFSSSQYVHEYTDTSNSSKTITFTCSARRLILSSKSVSISLEVSTVLDFDHPVVTTPNGYTEYTSYDEKGYNIAVPFIMIFGLNFYITTPLSHAFFNGQTKLNSQVLVNCRSMIIKRNDGKLFDFNRFDLFTTNQDSVIIEGYYIDGTQVSMKLDGPIFSNGSTDLKTIILPNTWKNLARVQMSRLSNCSIFDNLVLKP